MRKRSDKEKLVSIVICLVLAAVFLLMEKIPTRGGEVNPYEDPYIYWGVIAIFVGSAVWQWIALAKNYW